MITQDLDLFLGKLGAEDLAARKVILGCIAWFYPNAEKSKVLEFIKDKFGFSQECILHNIIILSLNDLIEETTDYLFAKDINSTNKEVFHEAMHLIINDIIECL